MVEPEPGSVEARLLAGEIECESCLEGALGPWGHARERPVWGVDGENRIRPRRGRCRNCRVTHVLLPVVLLSRCAYTAEVVIDALMARFLERRSRTEVAREAGAARDTVRGWTRRFRERAGEIAARFAAWASAWDADLGPIPPTESVERDALEAIGVAHRARERELGSMPLASFCAAISGGLLVSNTSCPRGLPQPGGG
jgi:hypothetical protein